MPNSNLLFLTLQVFSATGGIEKVCKVACKALNEIVANKGELKVLSMYDKENAVEEKYLPAQKFKGFNKRKFDFVKAALKEGTKNDVVILSHINLLIVGFLIKMVSPKTKLLLFTHGIEVWGPLSFTKKYMLKRCDKILSVSHFTKTKMIELYGLPEDKFIVLNNCLDPFLPPPSNSPKDERLLKKFGIGKNDFVFLTLTRLSFKERYKGYDNVMYALKELKVKHPFLKYLIIGKYDSAEKARLDKIIQQLSLQQSIVFTGYVPDEDLANHFNLADSYIMPSKKEGFGIVFIEAMYYGLPVIAGNIDGSVDALLNGALGLLVNPDNQEEIKDAIEKVIVENESLIPDRNLLMQQFSYESYMNNLNALLQKIA